MQAFNLLTMTTFAERVRAAMEEAGHTQSSLARAVGLTRASISFWLNGQTKEITGDNLLKAASALNVSPVWLAVGRGPMKDTSPASQPDAAMPREGLAVKNSWPFPVSREDYEALSERDRAILNELMATFVSSCLRSDASPGAHRDVPTSVSGVIGGGRASAQKKRTGTTE